MRIEGLGPTSLLFGFFHVMLRSASSICSIFVFMISFQQPTDSLSQHKIRLTPSFAVQVCHCFTIGAGTFIAFHQSNTAGPTDVVYFILFHSTLAFEVHYNCV